MIAQDEQIANVDPRRRARWWHAACSLQLSSIDRVCRPSCRKWFSSPRDSGRARKRSVRGAVSWVPEQADGREERDRREMSKRQTTKRWRSE